MSKHNYYLRKQNMFNAKIFKLSKSTKTVNFNKTKKLSFTSKLIKCKLKY